MNEQHRIWTHQNGGDSYIPVFGDWIMSEGHPPEHIWHQLDHAYTSLSAASRAGLHAQGSDDFNLAVMRRGHVVALLWMTEVIDESPDVLSEIQQVIRLTTQGAAGKLGRRGKG